MRHPAPWIAAPWIALLLGWQACIYGASHAMPFLGPVVVAVLTMVQSFGWNNPIQQLRLACLTAIVGTVVESVSIGVGLYLPASGFHSGWLCPLWITALWLQVGVLVASGSVPLADRPVLAAAFGAGAAVGGYCLAAWLGAIRVLVSPMVAIPIWALFWAGSLPILLGRVPTGVAGNNQSV